MIEEPAAIRTAIERGEVRRVLAVRVARLGDTLAVLPALELLRAALPAAEVALLASAYAAPLLRGLPVDRVLAWPHKGRGPAAWLARRRAAAALAARGAPDLWLGLEDKVWGRRLAARLGARFTWATSPLAGHLVERKAGVLRPLGLWTRGPAPWVRLAPDPALREELRARIAALPRPRVGLQAGSYAPALRWRERRRDPRPEWLTAFGALAAQELGASFVLQAGLGGAETRAARATAARLASAGAKVLLLEGLDAPRLHALLAELDLLVSPNTGPAHIATAAGTPVVLLEGPSTALARPWCPPERLAVISLGMACSPCRGTVHGRLCQVPRCLDELAPAAALAAARGLLAQRGG